ncbi:MAG: cupin domain-containing protein, partial [Lentisphaerae bacterium]|nr:cupin domain-containing protein [Lentisphaerota bacterium]
RYRLNELPAVTGGHVFSGVLPGAYLCMGGMGFKRPGERTHTNDGPGGRDLHAHDDDREAFVILQGKARMEVDGKMHPLAAGDIVVIEPGEDHHLISDAQDPCVNLWLHAGPRRHPDQSGGAGRA